MRTSTNAEYPYPVSRHDPYNSSTRARARTGSNSQTPLAERNGALSRDSGCGGHYCHDELIQPVCVMKPPRWPTGPTNHVPVPQREFREEYIPKRPSYKDAHIRYPPITFQTFGIPELGVRVGKVAERYAPSIVGGNDPVFAAAGDREVKFWILVCCPHRARGTQLFICFGRCSGLGTALSLCRKELRPAMAQ